ncbi:unnamed protein product [Calypogeia fissa]
MDIILNRRPPVGKSSIWHGGSRSYRKIGGSNGEGREAYSHIQDCTEAEGKVFGDENDKRAAEINVHLNSTSRESTGVGVVIEVQKRRREEEFLQEQFGEGEEWRRKDSGWAKPPTQPLVERIFLNDEEEDGVHGGRMKPLISFDLNTGVPPPQNRKLKIKWFSTEENRSYPADGAAPKGIRRSHDKENGALVPLCSGTTQIKGMKRKTVSPIDLKPQGGKRARPPNESSMTTDDSRKGPVSEVEGDKSQGMDMLLMALAADPNQRPSPPSQLVAKKIVVQATIGEKVVNNARSTLRVVAAVTPLCQPQVQTTVPTEDETASRQEELKASRSKTQATMQYPQVKVKEKVDVRKDDVEVLSSSDEDEDLSPEEWYKKYGPVMRPHRVRHGPLNELVYDEVDGRKDDKDLNCSDDDESDVCKIDCGTVEIKEKRGARKEDDDDLTCSDEDKTQGIVDLTKEDDTDSSSSDEDDYLSREELDRKYGPVMRPHRVSRGPFQYPWDKSKEREECTGRGEDIHSSKDSLKKNAPGGHGYCMTSREALDTPEKKMEGSKEEEGLICSEDGLDWKRGDGATETCFSEQQRKVVATGKAFPDTVPVAHAKLLDSRKMKHKAKNSNQTQRDGNESYVDGNARGAHQYQSAASVLEEEQEEMERDLKARELEEAVPSCSGEDPGITETVIMPHLSKVHPSQARVLSSQEQNISQRVFKEHKITGLKCSTSFESRQHHHKVSKHGPTGHDTNYGTSHREDSEDGSTIVKSHNFPYAWGKYPGGRQQVLRKELAGSARTADYQQLSNTKKRKTTGSNAAFCIIPKQVKLSAASCLIENGEPSHPSVGPVVVECIPPSTEQKECNRAPFSEFQNRDAAVWRSRSYNSVQSDVEVGIWDKGKENISRVQDNTSDRPSSAGVKVSYRQDFQVASGAQNDASSVHLSRSSSVPKFIGSRTLGDNYSGNSLHALPSSRIHVTRADSKTIHSSGLHFGSRVQNLQQEQQQQHPRSSPGVGSGACTANQDNETRHEIAGITVRRRSWEALKSAEAEYFAKRRFDPKVEAIYNNNNYVPFIPSRFQTAEYPIQGVKPRPDLEAHLQSATSLSRPIGNTTHEVIVDGRVTHRRGPKQGSRQERLSTKVLNRNLEHFVQLNDAGCHQGIALSGHTQAQNGAHFHMDVSQLHVQPKLPLPRSCSGVPKLPSLKTRQRRGPKKFDKERLKTISTKSTGISCHFKSLSEPSGLLGSLNPGIIGRVRNSKQIHAILGALIGVASSKEGREATASQDSACVPVMLEPEGELKVKPVEVQEIFVKEEYVPQQENGGEVARWTTGRIIETERLPERHQVDPLPSNVEQSRPLEVPNDTSEVLPECAAGLASVRDEAVNGDHLQEQSESAKDDNEQELRHTSVIDSSSPAAGLAARWLELLSLDAKGRLSALKRSRSRVQSTLLSGPFNPESGSADVMAVNPPSTTSAIDMDVLGSQQSVSSDAVTTQTMRDESSQQVDRWRALFTNMDAVLGNEATKLERWLWQIEQMQAFCPSSTTQQSFSAPEKSHVAFSQGPSTSNPEIESQQPQRLPLTIDSIEKELGFSASAASILSTANFVTKVQKFR